MNKHLKTYLLSVSTLLICSCAKNDMLVESPPEAGRLNIPICFAGSYVDNAATRHANRLCDHSSTMGVWGWFTDTKKNTTRAFNDQAVTYNPDSTRWEYTPLQYWHEGSQYYFCAYAPHQGKTDARVSIDSTTHMISIQHSPCTAITCSISPLTACRNSSATPPTQTGWWLVPDKPPPERQAWT